MKNESGSFCFRVCPETKEKLQKTIKVSNLTGEQALKIVIETGILEKKNERIREMLREKFQKSIRASKIKDNQYTPMFLFLQNEVAEKVKEKAQGMNIDLESVIETLIWEGKEFEGSLPIEEFSEREDKEKRKDLSFLNNESSEEILTPTEKAVQKMRWIDQPKIFPKSLNNVRARLIEETTKEIFGMKGKYRACFCEKIGTGNGRIEPYQLEISIEQNSGTETISQIDLKAFRFWRGGYRTFSKLQKNMERIEELFGKLRRGEIDSTAV